MLMLTLDQTQALIGDHVEEVLAAPFEKAVATWHRFVQRDPDMAVPLNATTRANMIHDWAAREVRAALVDHSSAREFSSLGFFAVAFSANPLVRLKFLNGGRPSNVVTEQQERLAKQRYDETSMAVLAIEGIPNPPTFLTCGYRLDYEMKLTRVEIRCDYNGMCLWSWPIWGDELNASTFEAIPLPLRPAPEPAAVRSTRPAIQARAQEEQ